MKINDFQIKTLQEKYKIKIIRIDPYTTKSDLIQRINIIYEIPKLKKQGITSCVVEDSSMLYERVSDALNINMENYN